MGKSTPQPPPQPNPQVVGAAQTNSNVNTAVANSVLGNANQYGPDGSTTFAENPGGGRYVSDGNGGQIYVPQYNQTTTLSPGQQQIYDQGAKLDTTLGTVAQHQADTIGDTLGTAYTGPGGQPIQRSVGGSTSYSDQVGQYQDALMSKLNPQLDHDSQLLDTKLANEGYVRGTDEYARQMDLQNKNAQDARTSAILAAGQYGTQLQGMDIAQGNFANTATDQQLKQDLAIRNQPINEVSALTSGSQVSLPQTTPYQSGQVAGTPIGDYYQQDAAMANANYQAALQASAQKTAGLYGGIGSLAGAGLYGIGRSTGNMATDSFEDFLRNSNRSTTQRMIEALMARAGTPTTSLGGALGNAGALGIMGLIEKQDEDKKLSDASKASDAQVRAVGPVAPMGNVPPVGSAPPMSPLVQSLRGGDNAVYASAPLDGGGSVPLPPSRPSIDRTRFVNDANDPAMVQRLANIDLGETGGAGASLEQRQVQLESALNRATSRNQGVGDVTRDASTDKRGYYPFADYKRQASPSETEDFRRNVLAPVLRGSDVSTTALGFPATGNASGGVAASGIANGKYAQSGMVGPETYVQEPRLDNVARIDAARNPAGTPADNSLPAAATPVQFAGPGVPTPPVGYPQWATPQSMPRTSPDQQLPTSVQMQQDPQLTNLLNSYYQTQDPRQRISFGQQIKEMQGEQRKRQEALQGQDWLKQRPAFSDLPGNTFAKTTEESAAKNPYDIGLKAAPNYADIPGNAGAKAGAEETAKLTAKRDFTQENNRPQQAANTGMIHDTVGRVLKQIDSNPQWAAGMGGAFSWLPNTLPKDVGANIETLRSIATVDTLQKMREASPTGGAVGNVSNYEDRMLASVRGSLDQMQSPDQLKYNIARLERVMTAIANPTGKTIAEQEQAVRNAYGPGAPDTPSAAKFNYDAVKSGETYTAPDGSTRTKR